jgi:predicted DNA-binding transcriptional regulator YafY
MIFVTYTLSRVAAATRDIGIYKDLSPNNLDYDTKNKVYVYAESFSPVFDFPAERVMTWLSQGFGDSEPSPLKSLVTSETPSSLTKPSIDTLACVTRAIHQECAMKVTYYSLSSGETNREIVPFALIDNGLRWHVRAFDRRNEDFRDFVITRMKCPVILIDNDILPREKSDQDIQWTRIVELDLVPHPDQPHSEIAEMDYGMTDGKLKVKLRAATAGYILRKWSVDCSADHCLHGPEFRLWLKDHLALYGVKNAILAPGYSPLDASTDRAEYD